MNRDFHGSYQYSIFLCLCLIFMQSSLAASYRPDRPTTATPIRYLVILYQENASFDSYFGTYPLALNPHGSPAFHAKSGTPSVNGLNETLLNFSPNEVNPFRIARLQSYTCDQNHKYQEELEARNLGLMNMYVEFGARGPKAPDNPFCKQVPINGVDTFVTDMGYFDGNTVTALWNYAQHFAMSDNFFATMPGESTRGVINLAAADTFGALCTPANGKTGKVWVDDGLMVPFCDGPVNSVMLEAPTNGNLGTLLDDADPFWDICSEEDDTVAMSGRNIGDLLNEHAISWGWFQDGFADCSSSHPKVAYDIAIGINPDDDPVRLIDYVAHHNPFQYYQSTANPTHLPPTSVAQVGHNDQANHQYDISWFWAAAEAGNLPAVSLLKPANYQNGHPGQSDALDEQVFIVETLNRLQRLPEWHSMAVLIAWDDSDGWYDHVMPPVINRSTTSFDMASMGGGNLCGAQQDGPGGRCAYGPRLPFLVISPFAKGNYVSHVLNDQTSITRFIEDNWLGGERISDGSDEFPKTFDNKAGSLMDFFDFSKSGRGEGRGRVRRLFLDPMTGEVINGRHRHRDITGMNTESDDAAGELIHGQHHPM